MGQNIFSINRADGAADMAWRPAYSSGLIKSPNFKAGGQSKQRVASLFSSNPI